MYIMVRRKSGITFFEIHYLFFFRFWAWLVFIADLRTLENMDNFFVFCFICDLHFFSHLPYKQSMNIFFF